MKLKPIRIASLCLLISISLYAYLLLFVMPVGVVPLEEAQTTPPPIFHYLITFSTIVGVVFSILSIRSKEKKSFLSILVIILNILFGILTVGSILFAQAMDNVN